MNECFSLCYRYDELRTIIKSLKNKKKIRDVSNVLNGNHLIFIPSNLHVQGYTIGWKIANLLVPTPKKGAGFSLRAFKEYPRDSLCGVKGSLIMIQGFVVLKRLKLLPKF